MSAYAISLTAPPEGGARGSHLPTHVGRGAGDLSQAWSSQIRRSGDLRPSFAAVDGPLRRLRERDGANVWRSGITLITLGYNVRRYVLRDSSSGRSAAPSPSTTRKVQAHQVLSTPTRTIPPYYPYHPLRTPSHNGSIFRSLRPRASRRYHAACVKVHGTSRYAPSDIPPQQLADSRESSPRG